jgi:hypothetical protein
MSMKLFFVILLFPLQSFTQNISGVWKGNLYNDTTRQFMPYELAINEDKGKLNGYSYTVFLIDSTKMVGIKTLKIKNKDDRFFIEDDKLIYNNYIEPPAKGVRMFSTLSYSENDSTEVLSGSWNTNRTKEYNPLTGSILLEKKKKISKTEIVQKLNEIGLSDKLLSWYSKEYDEEKNAEKSLVAARINSTNQNDISVNLKNEKDENLTAIHEISKDNINSVKPAEPSSPAKAAIQQPVTEKQTAVQKNAEKSLPAATEKQDPQKNNGQLNQNNKVVTEPKKEKENKRISAESGIKTDQTVALITKEEKNHSKKTDAKVNEKKPGVSNDQPIKKEIEKEKIPEKSMVAVTVPVIKEVPAAVNKIPVIPPAAEISLRKIETIETVEIFQDSLVLSLFDNGTIDGDTVSVLINGIVVWPMVGLLEKAANKTIYLTPEMGDSISVVMYAETLGNIPPNTGLLVVRDGKINHEIRFSGDLKKNSAIILKRKKQQ